MLGAGFVGLGFFDFADGALDGGIALLEEVGGLLLCLVHNHFLLRFEPRYLLLVEGNSLFKVFLALAYVLAFVLPIAFVAGDVL